MTSSTPKAEEPSITPLGVPSGQDVPDAEKGETEPPVKAEEIISVNAQAGVRAIEAATTVWTKWHLIAAYFMIWWIYFISTLQEVVLGSLNPYVVSAFRLHSLTAAVGIMANIIGGLSKIPLAKLLDTWGRPQGLLLMLTIWITGFIMMASCKNVQTYAAAQVFSATGNEGVRYCLTVFVADTSSLKNRALMLAFASSPSIITAWLGGPISESLLSPGGAGWRWGFGIFTIVIPFVTIPLALLFLWNDRKARKFGLLEPTTFRFDMKAIQKFCVDVDLIGILILVAGMALFLLPFSLYSYQEKRWESPMIIGMLVAGIVLLMVFLIWEKYLAPVTFIPYELLTDRTVFLGGMMILFTFFNTGAWNSYFTSMLQIVWNLSVTKASYVSAAYGVIIAGWTFFFLGPAIRYTGRFKWTAAWFAVPLDILAIGLKIHFRQPGTHVGYIVMTVVFTAVAGGTISIAAEMAMMAPSDHQHIAVVLAMFYLFVSIGRAIGSTVSAAIWTGTFRDNLAKNLPSHVNVDRIYADLRTQLSYRWGSPERLGIAQAYADTHRLQLITSISALACALICANFLRDISIRNLKQVKGRVI
ncbi:MFS general substrate transporter [Corynespora cassiicola Philippines]|uniref:MFS general substrate transporter n=1 Tax=Corynespora cassiicola Philippines TaxID=1448308 RepID=A0A2T2NFB4_CORCC|nr:MFS general substrate transporter [Corynespora cassiicola Philippines]